MAVPAYRRTESKIEFIHTFNKLRTEVINILMRDFGIKARSYSVKLISDIYKLSDEDIKELNDIAERYDIDSYEVDKYPDWIINGWRNEIMMILNNIGIEIHSANSIYITNIQEYYCRRNHWNSAIGYLMALLDKLHEIIDCVNVKLGAYENTFNIIMKEVKLIKGVRKSDNKLLKKINDQLPYFNNGFVYNNYPYMPFVPNYCVNSNVVGPVRRNDMCVIVKDNTKPYVPMEGMRYAA